MYGMLAISFQYRNASLFLFVTCARRIFLSLSTLTLEEMKGLTFLSTKTRYRNPFDTCGPWPALPQTPCQPLSAGNLARLLQ